MNNNLISNSNGDFQSQQQTQQQPPTQQPQPQIVLKHGSVSYLLYYLRLL